MGEGKGEYQVGMELRRNGDMRRNMQVEGTTNWKNQVARGDG